MTALHSYPNMHISQSNTLHPNQLTNNSHVKILVLCYPLYFFFGCFGVFLCLKCTELLSYFCNNICRIPKETNNIIRSDHILENSTDYAIESKYEPPKESIEINTDDDNDDLPSYSEVYRKN